MRELLKLLFTGRDNTTWDVGRLIWFVGCVAFLVFEGHVVFYAHTFDMTNFGVGFGGLMMTGGGALLLKARTEPDGNSTKLDTTPKA